MLFDSGGSAHTKVDICVRYIIRLFGLTYFVLGLLKLHGLLFPVDAMVDYLGMPNPILFFFTNQMVLITAAFIEIPVGLFILISKRELRTLAGVLLWITAIAICYKFGLAAVHYKGPCGCLLGINRFLPISTATQKSLSDIILVAALIASLTAMCYAKIVKKYVK
jgi:hypothetical protein